MKKVAIINTKFTSGFPVEDLRFGNEDDKNFDVLEDSQRSWSLLIDNKEVGELHIESSFYAARNEFQDTMEEFEDMADDQRLVRVTEALLYRKMLQWDKNSDDMTLQHDKDEMLYSLNVFLSREDKAMPKPEALKEAEEKAKAANDDAVDNDESEDVLGEIAPVVEIYKPSAKALALREMAKENRKEISAPVKSYINKAEAALQLMYDSKYNALYNNTAGRVQESWRGYQPRTYRPL